MTIASRVVPLSGWGRYPMVPCRLAMVSETSVAAATVAGADTLIARGCGRSYGDSSLNPDLTVATAGMNRILAFDAGTGRVECEAGLLLRELIDVLLPRGWFPPVTPGTKFVTIGGMIASDVHGKNHHRHGSFCDHLEWIDLALGDGRVLRCSRDQNPDLFAATCGGMGLTGFILRAAFGMTRVPSAWVRQETRRAADLDAVLRLAEESLDWTYSVAWIDCLARGASLGRSVLFLGEHAPVEALPAARRTAPFAWPQRSDKAVPVDFPSFALGSLSVRLFNALYYRAQRPGEAIVGFDPYFYPLDAIAGWNRIYGRRGFVQYQCVLPLAASREGLGRLLEAISSAATGSFLAVLKRLGGQSFGLLSFPSPGYTLALDFPVSPATMKLLPRLDAIVAEHGGRIYLAKDARIDSEHFAAGYPRIEEFRQIRRGWSLDPKFASLQSGRLKI